MRTPILLWLPLAAALARAASPTALVLDHIRWQSYWLGLDPFSASGATLLQSADYAGYCVKSFDHCALFSLHSERPVFRADPSSSYSSEKAAGTWRLTPSQAQYRSRPEYSHTLSIGGVAIPDPLLTAPPSSQPSLFILQSRPLTRKLLGPLEPTAIRLRQRPSRLNSLLQSIRLQLFPRHAVRVVVPFFSDTDYCIPIHLVHPGGESSQLLVFQKDKDWWTFRPASDLGSPAALPLLAARIEKAAMLTLLANGETVWSH